MVAYNNPGYQKDYLYQKRNYRPSASISTQSISADNDSIDGIIRSSAIGELYQKNSGYLHRTRQYDLSQPIWFYKIMEMLASNNVSEEKKKTSYSKLSYASLN